ncbi:hypothetical protein TRAPUB_9360 [Trametes pubescens]|uniref:Uncharacterized protein n=1 Tax=Trametes pubescens TaxID=154538 RepID=A0A1M2W2K1_TRAPU|nr:hypothetical protein TRAPUB_9360 [Trametes pubescens]
MTATRDAIGQVCAQAFCMFNARPEVPAIYVMLVAHIKWTLVLFHRPPEWQQAAEKTQPSSTSSTSPRTPLARRPNYTQLEGYAEAIKKLKGELASTLATTLKLKSELLYFCEDCIRWPHVDASQGRVMFPPIYPTERFAKALRLVIEANRAADIIFDYQPSWYDVVDEQATKPDSQLLDEGEKIFEHAYGKMVCKIMEPLDELIRPDELEDAMEEMEAESKDGNYKPSQVKRAATRLRKRFLTRLQTTTPVKTKVRDQLPKLAPIRRPTGTAKAKFVPTSPTSPTPAGPRQGLPHVVTAPTTTKPGDVQQ